MSKRKVGRLDRIVDALALELVRCTVGQSRVKSLRDIPGPQRAQYRRFARHAVNLSAGDGFVEATCVTCGCTDSKGCEGNECDSGCSWVVVNRLIGEGVCSRCP